MADYMPNTPFNVPFYLLTPTYKMVKGVRTKTFEKSDVIYYCSFRTFGGTEKVVNDIVVLEDTAVIETWYDPSIKAECRMLIDGVVYEVMGTPENINKRNQYMKFKVVAIKGGA